MIFRATLVMAIMAIALQGAEAATCQHMAAPNDRVARSIYVRVAHQRGDEIKHADDIVVNDAGDHWEVFQYPKRLPAVRSEDGQEIVTVVAGGGTLELGISKCDGSILQANYAR